ncbi:hypothetical protein PO81_10530, partial [Vibrio parahaemolyticus]
VSEDYSARELNVKPGDKLESNRELNGWVWCVTEENEAGWVPRENLEVEKYDILSLYVKFMCEQFSFLKDFNYKFGVDCTNGAAGVVIKHLIKALNLKAHVMFAEPDGI